MTDINNKNGADQSMVKEPGEEDALIDNAMSQQPQPIQANKRGCLARICCLICCCDTGSIGSQSHLRDINEMEI